MRSLKFTLLFLAALAYVTAGEDDCVVPENYCSCYWDGTKIQCNVQYNFYNISSISVKSPPISGDTCGYFYYKCRIVNNNVQVKLNTCPAWLKHKQDGGENSYHCVKTGDIVECGITICDIENSGFNDVGKCNDPEWYVLHHDGESETTLTAVTINGVLVGVPGAESGGVDW